MKLDFRIDFGYLYLYSRRHYHPQYIWDGSLACEGGKIERSVRLDYPVIWFGGLAALLFCIIRSVGERRYSLPGSTDLWHLKTSTYDPRYMFIFTGIMAQYLPWVLVPRGTYIYHYFASLPFLMLALSLSFDWQEKKRARIAKTVGMTFVIFAAVAFILLFPYASGISVPAEWLDIGKNLLKIWY